MHLRHRQVRNEWPDQHGIFALSDEGRGGCHDGFGAGDAHRPEEEDRELADEPLQHAPVVEELDERNEEDDGWNDASEKPRQIRHGGICEEYHTVVGEAEEIASEFGNKCKDIAVR